MTINPFRPAQFLADIASPFTSPGLGPIAGYTNSFSLNLVNFDWTTWHQYEWQNWQQVDALLRTVTELIGVEGIRGIWQPSTAYSVDDIVYDPADLTLTYICVEAHTSSSSFVTDEPLYWNPSLDFSSGVFAATGPLPRIQFTNTSAVAPAGAYRIVAAVDDSFRIEKNTAVAQDFSAVSLLMTIEAAGTAISGATAAVTKEKGDLRYAQLALATPQTFAGPIVVGDMTYSTSGLASINGVTINAGSGVIVLQHAGVEAARIDVAGTTLTDAQSVVTQEKGDFRYPQLAATSLQTFSGPIHVSDLYIGATPAGVAEASTISSATTNGLIFRSGVDSLPNTQFFRQNGTLTARIDTEGTSASVATTVITREKGDFRYAQLAAANAFTVAQKISYNTPTLLFHETDAVSPAGQYSLGGGVGGNFFFQRYAGANFTSAAAIFAYDHVDDLLNFTVRTRFDTGLYGMTAIVAGAETATASDPNAKVSLAAGIVTVRRVGTSNQTHANFVNNQAVASGTTVGTISTSGSTTAYNTTSDENLKTFTGLLDPQRAIDILRVDPPREFDWKDGSGHGVGWGAQTSYGVSPDLASPPPEWVPDEEVYPDVRTAPKAGEPGYVPWSMDLSKRVPYLAAALVHALDKIDELTARVIALESV